MIPKAWRLVGTAIIGATLSIGCTDPDAELYFADPSDVSAVSFNPADQSIDVPANTLIQVELSREIDGSRLNEATFTVADADDNLVTLAPPSYQLRILTLEPEAGTTLTAGLVYTVRVRGLRDLIGREVASIEFSFTVVIDNQAPSIVRRIPANGSAAIPINNTIVVQFDEPLDDSDPAIVAGWLTVQDTGVPVPGNILYDSLANAIVFRAAAGMPTSLITVNVLPTVTDRAGNGASADSFTFTTDGSVDTKAPTFPAVAPTAAANGDDIDVTWPAGTDLTAPANELRYVVRVTGTGFPASGVPVAAAYDSTALTIPQLPFGDYSFFIEVVDPSGNRREFPCSLVAEPCPPSASSGFGAIEFLKDVRPILQNSCGLSNCHLGVETPGFVDLSDASLYQDLIDHVDPVSLQRLVVPFDPNLSYLYWKIADEERLRTQQQPFPYDGAFMPPTQLPPLPYGTVGTIRTWIEQGAPE